MDDILEHRLLPALASDTAFFWTSGQDGRLRFMRCQSCGWYLHPPSPRCPQCLSSAVAPEPVSGHGTVYSFTVNVQQWIPGTPPYAIVVVELAEQEGLRLTSNLVGVDLDAIRIGMPVEVAFVHRDDVWLPLFRKVSP